MKLLFDQNLSRRLPAHLVDILPGSSHVRDFGLAAGDDSAVWELAKLKGFTIISKDDDFRIRVQLFGHPPRVVMLKLGNCSTENVEGAIRRRLPQIIKLHADVSASLLLVTPSATFLLSNHDNVVDRS